MNATQNSIIEPQDIDQLNKKELLSDYILFLGDHEEAVPNIYNELHHNRAYNSMQLRNWLRDENLRLQDIKAYFGLISKSNSFDESITAGFLAFLFNLENDYISFVDWSELPKSKLVQSDRKFNLIKIIHSCARYELSKADNFLIHEWEANRWFDTWSGISVDWSDWIEGPKTN